LFLVLAFYLGVAICALLSRSLYNQETKLSPRRQFQSELFTQRRRRILARSFAFLNLEVLYALKGSDPPDGHHAGMPL